MTRKPSFWKTSHLKSKLVIFLILLSATFVLRVMWIGPRGTAISDTWSEGIFGGSRSGNLSSVTRSGETFHGPWSGNLPVVVVTPKKLFTREPEREIAFLQRGPSPLANETAKKKVIFLASSYTKNAWTDNFFYFQSGINAFEGYQCPYSNCLVTRDQARYLTADAALFHLRDVEIMGWPGQRLPKQKWILYTMEPPWLEYIDEGRLDGIFNWTMTYRDDSDIVIKYGFVGGRIPSLGTDPSVQRRTKKDKFAAWYVGDCCTDSRREDYVTELRKYVTVDVFGLCGVKQCQPQLSKSCYKLLNSYRFYLSFENAICKDYVTEKFFNVLEHDVIPVVMGGANYSSVAPPGSYVDALRFRSPRHLAEYLKTLAADEDKYWKFFDWKRRLKSYLPAWPCDLCAKLNTDSEVNTVRTGLHKWWNTDAQCKGWTSEGFRTGLSPVIPPCFGRPKFT